jgi:ribonuclease Z
LRALILICALLTAFQAAAQDSLRVTLLGTFPPFPNPQRFGISTLVEAGNQKFVFDVGRGTLIRLWQQRIPAGQVSAVFLTHLHSDHIVGLPDFWLTGALAAPFGARASPLHVFGPTGTAAMVEHLTSAYRADIDMRIEGKEVRAPAALGLIATEFGADGVIWEREGVKVTAFKVEHGAALAFGFRVDYRGHSVLISGDTRPSANLVRFATGVDVLVHEVVAVHPGVLDPAQSEGSSGLMTPAFAKHIVSLHTTPEQAGEIFAQAKPRLAVFTHLALLGNARFPAPTPADILAGTRRTYAGRVEVGEDLMTIEVGDEIRVARPAAR